MCLTFGVSCRSVHPRTRPGPVSLSSAPPVQAQSLRSHCGSSPGWRAAGASVAGRVQSLPLRTHLWL